jgi:hypothetical protein
VSIEALLSEQKAVVQHVQQPFFWFAKWGFWRGRLDSKRYVMKRIGYFAILQSNEMREKGKKDGDILKQGES